MCSCKTFGLGCNGKQCNCNNISIMGMGVQAKRVGSLGLTPASSRSVRPIPAALLALVPKPTGKVITVKSGVPDVERDTMPDIIAKIKRTAWQVKDLAPMLKGATVAQTLKNVSQFMLDHIKYVKDDPAHEQVRDPSVTIHQGKGDCDCMTVLVGALLRNLNIPFRLRIAKYANNPTRWAHIYVIVLGNGTYTTLDPVTNRHNYEVKFIDKKDYNMALHSLEGLGDLQSLEGPLGDCAPQLLAKKSRAIYVPVKALTKRGYTLTSDTLNKLGIRYTVNNSGDHVVNTPQGARTLPAVINQNQKALITTSLRGGMGEAPEEKKSNAFPWLLVAGVATVVVLAASGGSDSKKKTDRGLSGGQRKVPVLHL